MQAKGRERNGDQGGCTCLYGKPQDVMGAWRRVCTHLGEVEGVGCALVFLSTDAACRSYVLLLLFCRICCCVFAFVCAWKYDLMVFGRVLHTG